MTSDKQPCELEVLIVKAAEELWVKRDDERKKKQNCACEPYHGFRCSKCRYNPPQKFTPAEALQYLRRIYKTDKNISDKQRPA